MTMKPIFQTSQNDQLRMARALQAIEKLQAKLSAVEAAKIEPIAVVGMGCRFPGGSNSPAAFWELLSAGKDAITQVPSDRWNAEAYYDPDPDAPGKIVTQNGGFVDHLKEFDAGFFGLSPREAVSLDPQQRLLLEVSWEAMEQGGMVPHQWTGRPVGIFVGISSSDYSQHLAERDEAEIDAYLATGNAHSTAAGRLSYSLGFTGPSLGVDTACSSSLIAVHLACQSLRNRECEAALAGGVNRILAPAFSINFSKAHMLAPDGRCKTFDAAADGFSRGEGCGVVVLKRLSDAVAQGDNILAVVRGSAVNQDGRSGGLTVPNGPAQQQVIRQAIALAKIQPAQVSYIETHGTGTALGDPIEVGALGAVFGQSHSQEKPLTIGSVKTNIGHLEAAAGIAGLIKVVLAMQHKTLPAHLHFQQPSPHINWDSLPIRVTRQAIAWPSGDSEESRPDDSGLPDSVFAGVSSFGFGGTNAHVIVESAAKSIVETVKPDDGSHLLTLSAKDPAALQALASRYLERLAEPGLNLRDLCWSAWALRSHFPHRLAIVASAIAEAKTHLSAYLQSPQSRCLPSSLPTGDQRQGTRLDKLFKLGQRYVEGADIVWPDEAGQRVGLPTYPFQRERYWVDVPVRRSPSTKAAPVQQTRHPLVGDRLPLAGTRAIHFEAVISPTTAPLFQAHQVFDAAVLPAVGYLEMALAASRAIRTDHGWAISDVSFHQALLLDTAQTVQTVLTPTADRHQFEIFSLTKGNQWQRHASGYLTPALESNPSDRLAIEQLQRRCPSAVPVADCYRKLQSQGVTYGDSFRTMQQIYAGENRALSRLRLPENLLSALETYTLHPVLLDACLQSIAAIFTNEPETTTYLPAAISQVQMWVPTIQAAELWSYVEVTPKENWLMADVQILSLEGDLLVSLKELRLQPASRERVLAPQSDPSVSSIDDWFYTLDWQEKPLPASLPLPDVESVVERLASGFSQALAEPTVQSYLRLLPQLEALSLGYMVRALVSLNGAELPDDWDAVALMEEWAITPAHQALFRRLTEIVSNTSTAHNPIDRQQLEAWQKQLLKQHPEARAELTIIQRCGGNLANVLQGKIDPLTLLFPAGDLSDLTRLYQDSPGAQLMNRQIQQAAEIVLSQCAATPRILEIGAGTGGTTAHLLPHLAEADYVFTDVSPLFLAKAKERFTDYPNLTYQPLDIEQAVEPQGFKLSDYDLIIASNVLHATADISRTLENVRSLLKPGGQLVLLEGTKPLLWLDLIFGMTAGWWKRPTHPLLSAAQWQQHLQSAGFTTAALVPADDPSGESTDLPQSIIIAATPPADQTAAANWLILAEPTSGVGTQLAQAVDGWLVSSKGISAEAFSTLFTDLSVSQQWPEQIVYFVSPPAIDLTQLSGERLETLTQQTATQLLSLVKTCTQRPERMPQLNIVTQGVVDGGQGGLVQSPAWGLASVIEREYPALQCRRIDLDPSESPKLQLEWLIKELRVDTAERVIAYRKGARQVARLVRSRLEAPLALPTAPFKLALSTKGSPDNLQLVPSARRQPQAGEVEICVQAAGLNFIDVLDALALLPFERDWLGVECAGNVVSVGQEVEQFAVGDAVLALAAGSFSQYVTVPVAQVVAQPKNLSTQAAATIPANSLTAHYALERLTELKEGDRILIHSAAGGTGMAAVKIAQRAGAEIYATASPSKWAALKAMGVTHIMSSRTLDFAEEIMAKTDQQGVDVVLNALSGEFIEKSLSVLAEKGRFLEIGKRDIWTTQQVAQARPDVEYHIVDLMAVARDRPQQIQTMLRALKEQFESKQLTPVRHHTFPVTQAPQAFRYMQQAQHIGKIVLDFPAAEKSFVGASSDRNSVTIQAEGTYLITGGTGGLGMATASWLVQQGARHLALISRGSISPPDIELLREQGVKVLLLQADMANRDQLASALATLKKTLPPLRGVIHAAGVLADGVLQQLEWAQMRKVLAPKVWGAWNLHQLTADCPLDFFVLYSSAASLLGSPGQGSHVAANSFLDAIARHRQTLGLPALSINWGPWAEVGSAAGTQAQQQMQQRGMEAIAPKQGLQALSKLLAQTTLNQVGVMAISWPQFSQQGIERDPFFSYFTQNTASSASEARQERETSDWLSQLETVPEKRRVAFLVQKLQTAVSKILARPDAEQVEPTASFFDMGMDSLMSVELKNQLETQLGQHIAATAIFEYPTVQTLATHLSEVADKANNPNPPPVDGSEHDTVPPRTRQKVELELPLKPPRETALETASETAQTTVQTTAQKIEQELAALEQLLDRS